MEKGKTRIFEPDIKRVKKGKNNKLKTEIKTVVKTSCKFDLMLYFFNTDVKF